jgi:hypothetical protein
MLLLLLLLLLLSPACHTPSRGWLLLLPTRGPLCMCGQGRPVLLLLLLLLLLVVAAPSVGELWRLLPALSAPSASGERQWLLLLLSAPPSCGCCRL